MLFIPELGLSTSIFILLVICVLAVCFFEFVNGFHDTANAVATVIHTNSLRPTTAVALSGFLNFLGVLLGGLGVAWGILKLIPLTELMHSPLETNIAFMLAVLIGAISWNLGTWYLGLPASSSHTLIGCLVGASWMYSSLSPEQTHKAYEIFLFLFISPIIGFVGSLLLLKLMYKLVKNPVLYQKPEGNTPPPLGIRILIILGCIGVSFNHGANDGQKGVGLLMVTLIAFLPSYFALHPDFDAKACSDDLAELKTMLVYQPTDAANDPYLLEYNKVVHEIDNAQSLLATLVTNPDNLSKQDKLDIRSYIRNQIPEDTKTLLNKVERQESLKKATIYTAEQRKEINNKIGHFSNYTDFAPTWAIILISLCLGLGTMIGWQRIVETIGEKIGKSGFDYSQGFVSQFVSTLTIGLSTILKLPVSTTHIVSTSIMGTMFAKGGRKNIQKKTITSIFTAWILTLPVSIGLSAGLYWILNQLLS